MLEFKKLDPYFKSKMHFDETDENIYIDLHLHTIASDSTLTAQFFYDFLPGKNHLISITDHNEIRKNLMLHERGWINIIPGIELGCNDGFELLLYFDRASDLEEFYRKYVEPHRSKLRMVKTSKDVYYYLDKLEQYDVFMSIPHISGYAHKSFLKKTYIEDLILKCGALETYNHTLGKKRNLTAKKVRKRYHKTATFGSDGHSAAEIKSFYKFQNDEYSHLHKIGFSFSKIYTLGRMVGKHGKYLIKNQIIK